MTEFTSKKIGAAVGRFFSFLFIVTLLAKIFGIRELAAIPLHEATLGNLMNAMSAVAIYFWLVWAMWLTNE